MTKPKTAPRGSCGPCAAAIRRRRAGGAATHPARGDIGDRQRPPALIRVPQLGEQPFVLCERRRRPGSATLTHPGVGELADRPGDGSALRRLDHDRLELDAGNPCRLLGRQPRRAPPLAFPAHRSTPPAVSLLDVHPDDECGRPLHERSSEVHCSTVQPETPTSALERSFPVCGPEARTRRLVLITASNGIAPGSDGWARRDSNPGPPRCERGALTN